MAQERWQWREEGNCEEEGDGWTNLQNKIKSFVGALDQPIAKRLREGLAINTTAMPLDQVNGSTMVLFFFRVGPFL